MGTERFVPYSTPEELVSALQLCMADARKQLHLWCHASVKNLMETIALRNGLQTDLDVLTRNALRSVEAYLRTRQASEFRGSNERTFCATILVHIARVALAPFGQSELTSAKPSPPIPTCVHCVSEILSLPLDHVDGHDFGGDWLGGTQDTDKSLWVFLADVAGHGYAAYLLASHLPDIWQLSWDISLGRERSPVGILRTIHQMLEECLPEGTFVEACLVRLAPDGNITIAPAGGTRLILRQAESSRAELHSLQGSLLGILPPELEDQRSWVLGIGDEVLFGTDGLFDQLSMPIRVKESPQILMSFHKNETLLESLRRSLDTILQERDQEDDISAVMLCKSDLN